MCQTASSIKVVYILRTGKVITICISIYYFRVVVVVVKGPTGVLLSKRRADKVKPCQVH